MTKLRTEKKTWIDGLHHENGRLYVMLNKDIPEDELVIMTQTELDSLIDKTVQITEERIMGLIEKQRRTEPLYIGETQFRFYEGNVDWVYNGALDDLLPLITNKSDINLSNPLLAKIASDWKEQAERLSNGLEDNKKDFNKLTE